LGLLDSLSAGYQNVCSMTEQIRETPVIMPRADLRNARSLDRTEFEKIKCPTNLTMRSCKNVCRWTRVRKHRRDELVPQSPDVATQQVVQHVLKLSSKY
jgi:hypothetical protein